MGKKTIYIIICIILFNLLTACWDAKELNELAITLVMGLDMEDEKILLTAEVVDFSNVEDNSSNSVPGDSVKYIQGVGNNIFEAFRDIILKFDYRIFASHNRVLIIGEEFAKNGIIKHIDELFRDSEQRETAYVLIAKDAKAYEVMGVNAGLEKIPANYIVELVENVKENPKILKVNMIKYLENYYHGGLHPTVGVIQKRKIKKINGVDKKDDNADYELSLIGSAVFNEDVLIGYLNGNNTKSLNFILDNIENGIITFPTPVLEVMEQTNSGTNHDDVSSVIIIKSKTKNDIEISNDNVILKTHVKLKGSVGEVGGNIDISKGEIIKEIEKACSKAIEENIKNAVREVQEEFETDVFAYGALFHRKYPKEWKKVEKDWDKIFTKAEFQVKVKTDIIRTGLINTPIIRRKSR